MMFIQKSLLSHFFLLESRLLEKLPKLVLGCEETLALASAQQMLALMYYSGPQVVVDHLLRSPVCPFIEFLETT